MHRFSERLRSTLKIGVLNKSGLALLLAIGGSFPSYSMEVRGQVALEHRQFFEQGIAGQAGEQTSVTLEPEFYWEWHGGQSSVTFTPFGRWDSLDDNRTHADIRELSYLYYADEFEFKVGISKVFWGVTESQHLVDVINQTDGVESVDGEIKLGQPMIQLTWLQDWGTFEGFVLPYFRERTFASPSGRLGIPQLDTDNARYESSQEQHHIDIALRYSHSIDIWDLGFSLFQGTNRDPYLQGENPSAITPVLVPYYAQMSQISTDIQGIFGDWMWKLEALYRDSLDTSTAVTGGFEYTFIGVLDTSWDIGVLAEYLYDSRGISAPVLGQNDGFVGMRWVANDMAGTEVLLGVTQDFDYVDSRTARVEASSRIGNAWRWNVNAWWFNSDERQDPLYLYRTESFAEVALTYYY
ncbi:hypothetical protein [Photobacterium sanguinicancri]|uniref:hypothetical protein n=1 Tax=Photobacterium sanguinicancri TaxID=875932 RepID=UPI0021C3CDF8|nr:hypothetical protein [Photobacterium sanguinicancri]